MNDLMFQPIARLRRRIAVGDLTAHELARSALDRIETLDPSTHAFITVDRTGALQAADLIDRAGLDGPLAGIPYAAKDIFNTRGLRTTAGSRVLADHVPGADAAAIERLEVAGAVLVGKANMHEFCYGITGENAAFGTAANPFDPSRLAGGSSSGSAVAVALGMASFALGTDTGGSIRVPAALSGVIGLKPTLGRISTYGMLPFCWSLDHVGILARTIEDIALVLATLAGADPRDPACGDQPVPDYTALLDGGLAGLRIGVPRDFFAAAIDPAILSAVERTIEACRDLGARVIEVTGPDMTHVRAASLALQLVEALSWHGPRLESSADLYGEDLREGLAQGQFILGEHYVRARRLMEVKRRELAGVFKGVDLLLTPTVPMVAPKRGTRMITTGGRVEPVGDVLTRYTCLFNMTGNPALSIPCGRHPTGLPIGLQLVARPFEEVVLLRAARGLERAGAVGWIPAPMTEGGVRAAV